MANPSISLPDELVEEVDDRRGDVPRSRWIRRAIEARLDAEDRGEWESDDDDTSSTVEAPADD